jgi:MFS family permease
MSRWGVLAVLATAQFLMVLDQAVMNVAISQLVEDFDTTVTTIQAVIALYALTMAALMLTGGKLGDIVGRRRVFTIGLCIYATGSALTAASWSVTSLMLGWSILEGVGAALVLPALVARGPSALDSGARQSDPRQRGGIAQRHQPLQQDRALTRGEFGLASRDSTTTTLCAMSAFT